MGFPGGSGDGASQVAVKNLPANAGDVSNAGFDPWAGKIPWRRAQPPIPLLLPGPRAEQPGGYSPQGHKEWDTTEAAYHAPMVAQW